MFRKRWDLVCEIRESRIENWDLEFRIAEFGFGNGNWTRINTDIFDYFDLFFGIDYCEWRMMDERKQVEVEAELIAEQLRHTINLLRAELKMANHRLNTLERQSQDYEQRLRALTDSATQFKVLAGLATGGGLVSLLALGKIIFDGI